MRGISWLAANQLASQEGLCTMEWVSKSIYGCVNNGEDCIDIEGMYACAVAGFVLLEMSDSNDLTATSFQFAECILKLIWYVNTFQNVEIWDVILNRPKNWGKLKSNWDIDNKWTEYWGIRCNCLLQIGRSLVRSLAGVIGIFHWHKILPMTLGSTQPVTEMSTRSISWGRGVKAAGA